MQHNHGLSFRKVLPDSWVGGGLYVEVLSEFGEVPKSFKF